MGVGTGVLGAGSLSGLGRLVGLMGVANGLLELLLTLEFVVVLKGVLVVLGGVMFEGS